MGVAEEAKGTKQEEPKKEEPEKEQEEKEKAESQEKAMAKIIQAVKDHENDDAKIKMKEKADAEAEAMASKVEKEGDIKAKDEAIKGEKTKVEEMMKDLKNKEKQLGKQMEENVENEIKAEEKAVDDEEDKIKKARDDKEEFQNIQDNRYFDWFDEGQWPDPEYDCTTDYDRWRKKWTRMKEHHCCRVAGKGCQDNFPTTIVFKNLLGVQVRVGFMEERLKGGNKAEIIDMPLPQGAPRRFYFYPNQERE